MRPRLARLRLGAAPALTSSPQKEDQRMTRQSRSVLDLLARSEQADQTVEQATLEAAVAGKYAP